MRLQSDPPAINTAQFYHFSIMLFCLFPEQGIPSKIKCNIAEGMLRRNRLRDARPAGWVTYCSICTSTQCREPKTGQEKVQFYCKDDSHLPIIYLCIHLASDSPHGQKLREITLHLHANGEPKCRNANFCLNKFKQETFC